MATNFAIDYGQVAACELSRNKVDPLLRQLSQLCGADLVNELEATLAKCTVDITPASYESLAK